mmetsp:Transcript_32306/g.103020  ORF Transcript_32306/g.103020 Transcript_32306/m.103020 type:complete len:312 (-) Transcript_32306:532-1467(-)
MGTFLFFAKRKGVFFFVSGTKRGGSFAVYLGGGDSVGGLSGAVDALGRGGSEAVECPLTARRRSAEAFFIDFAEVVGGDGAAEFVRFVEESEGLLLISRDAPRAVPEHAGEGPLRRAVAFVGGLLPVGDGSGRVLRNPTAVEKGVARVERGRGVAARRGFEQAPDSHRVAAGGVGFLVDGVRRRRREQAVQCVESVLGGGGARRLVVQSDRSLEPRLRFVDVAFDADAEFVQLGHLHHRSAVVVRFVDGPAAPPERFGVVRRDDALAVGVAQRQVEVRLYAFRFVVLLRCQLPESNGFSRIFLRNAAALEE